MNNRQTLSPEATKKEVRQIIYDKPSDALGEFKPLNNRKIIRKAKTMNGHLADIN